MRNKLLFKPYILFVALACILFTGCSEEETYYSPVKYPAIKIAQIGYSGTDSIKVSFTSNILTSHFVYAIGTDEDFKSFEDGTLSTIRNCSGNEPFEYTFGDLVPNTNYVIFARGYTINEDGGAIASLKVRTTIMSSSSSVETQYVSDKFASFTILHERDYYKYHCYLGKPGEIEEFEKLADSNNLSEHLEKSSGYTHSFFDLTPDTDYVFYVRYYNRSNIPTEVYEVPITTQKAGSCPGLDSFRINSMNLHKGDLTFTFNDKTARSYVYIIASDDDDAFLDACNGDIWYSMIWNGTLDSPYATNSRYLTVFPSTLYLLLDHQIESPYNYPFIAYTAAFDEELKVYGFDRVEYTGSSFNPNVGDANVLAEVSDITDSTATYSFIPNEHTYCYYFGTFDAKYIDEGIDASGNFVGIPGKEEIVEYFKYNKDPYYGNSPVTYIEDITQYAGKDLYVIVAPMNENGIRDGMKELIYEKYVAK